MQSTWKFRSRLHPCKFIKIFGTVACGWMCHNLHMSEKVNGSREIRMRWEPKDTHHTFEFSDHEGVIRMKSFQLHRKTHFMGLLLLAWCWCFATVENGWETEGEDEMKTLEIIDSN